MATNALLRFLSLFWNRS